VGFIRYALIAIGCLCLLAASCYEGEEDRIQNRIQEWWIRLDDTRQSALTRSALFLRAIARLTSCGFDWIFGKKLVSLRVIGVSICFSFASVVLFTLVEAKSGSFQIASPFPFGRLSFSVFVIGFALVPGMTESSPDWFIERGFLSPEKWVPVIWGIGLCVNLSQLMWAVILPLYQVGGSVLAAYVPVVLGIVLGVSLASDLICIGLTRWSLQLASQADQFLMIVVIMIINVLLVFVVVIAPVRIGVAIARFSFVLGAPIMFSILLNVINVVMCLSVFLVASLLLLHRVLWPVVERPLYLLQRYGVIKNKRLLWKLGLALVTLPTDISISFWKSLVTGLL